MFSRRLTPIYLFLLVTVASTVEAQITIRRNLSSQGSRLATLDEQLINRLRATTEEQQAFIHYVVNQVRLETLELRLVLAIERYALNRNSQLPFNFFERALRFEAGRRGVTLPAVELFVTTARLPTR